MDLRTVPVAQTGFFSITSMIAIPLIPVLISIEVDACGDKVVRIFFRFIIIGFFLTMIIPFEGILVRERVVYIQLAIDFKLLIFKGVSGNVHKSIRITA